MSITKERKQELITKFRKSDSDTGSFSVQVAVLTEKIKNLTEHMQTHKNDKHSLRGLIKWVGERRRQMKYLAAHDRESLDYLVKEMKIRVSQ